MSEQSSLVGDAIWTARSHPDNDEKKITLWNEAMKLSSLYHLRSMLSFHFSRRLFVSLASDMFGATADMKRLLDDKKVASGLKKQVKWRYYLFGAVSVFSAFLFRLFSSSDLSSWHITDVDVIGNIMAKIGRKATALRYFKELEDRYSSSILFPLPERTQCAISYALACKWVWPFLNAEERDACRKDVEEIRLHYELSPEVLVRLKEFLGEDDTEEMQALREKYGN